MIGVSKSFSSKRVSICAMCAVLYALVAADAANAAASVRASSVKAPSAVASGSGIALKTAPAGTAGASAPALGTVTAASGSGTRISTAGSVSRTSMGTVGTARKSSIYDYVSKNGGATGIAVGGGNSIGGNANVDLSGYATLQELGLIDDKVGVLESDKADKSSTYTITEIDAFLDGKQDILTPGAGIDITNGVVSVSEAQGAQGADGPQGPQGESGAMGPQGPQGEAGATGPQGAGAQGSIGLSAYEVAYGNGFNGTESEWLGSLVGPQGSTGPQGEAGAMGPQGAGGQGSIGLSAYEVAYGNGFNGTESEWLGSLVGPQGSTGPQGEAGAIGPQGAGAQGSIGLSAYEVAYGNGFNGTESEWLGSLVGPQGSTGPQGEAGATGPQGGAGATGPQGSVGLQGSEGPQGHPGQDANLPTCPTDANYALVSKPSGKVVCVAILD